MGNFYKQLMVVSMLVSNREEVLYCGLRSYLFIYSGIFNSHSALSYSSYLISSFALIINISLSLYEVVGFMRVIRFKRHYMLSTSSNESFRSIKTTRGKGCLFYFYFFILSSFGFCFLFIVCCFCYDLSAFVAAMFVAANVVVFSKLLFMMFMTFLVLLLLLKLMYIYECVFILYESKFCYVM